MIAFLLELVLGEAGRIEADNMKVGWAFPSFISY